MIYSESIRDLIERITIEHKELKQFYCGDYKKILGAQRNNVDYPLLWLEPPEITFPNDEDSIVEEYSLVFVILINSKLDDDERIRYNKTYTERIAKEIIMRLMCSQEIEGMDLIMQRTSMYPLDNIDSDNDQGWRVETAVRPISSGYRWKDSFNDIFPANTKAAFSWTVTEADGTYTVSIENQVTPALSDFDSYQFKFISDGEIELISDNENPTFTTQKKDFYIDLQITIKGNTRMASGHTLAATSGHSFPFIYNPFQ